LVRGYQAFLEFTPGALEFVDGSYMLPIPYGLPILSPISTVDDGIDLAAGIDNFGGQAPTDQPADLAVLTFMTGTTEGLAQVRFRLNEPTTQFSNALGQSLLPQLVDGPVLCVDGTPPALTCPPDLDLPSPDDLPPPALSYDEFVAQGGVAMDDNCFGPTPAVVTLLSESDNGGTGCPDNPHVITRVYRATDCALNFVDCTQMITVRDGAAPIFADVPADRQLAADAGTCAAVLTPELTPPTAIDNCTEAPPVLWTRSDGKPALTDPYDAADSPVTITWSSTDALGNEAIATTVITVAALNELVVTVELQPEFAAGPVTRCITFELWDCPATEPLATVQETVTFTAGLASAALLDVPCGTYSCITARDTLHALRRTQPLAMAGTQFVTSFTGDPNEGGDRLTGGNYNGDNWVDLLDFGVYSTQYATNPLAGANSGCATPAPHADANGDGIVNTADFTYIQINYLKSDEANCCGQPGLTGPGDPSTRIATSDLQALGLGELAHADVNADGWLDAQELVAFRAVTGTPARGVPAARGELPESEANPGRSE
jgi:hypothetical protein